MGSLFLPGAWLHAGSNSVMILDLNGGSEKSIKPEERPTYLEPRPE
jgi:hypothetical protein